MLKIYFPLVFVLLFLNNIYSQTEDIEKESLSNRYKKGEFSAETYQEYSTEWHRMILDLGGYPNLPYEETSGQIKFELIAPTNQSKKTNFNRILEWSAIKFGALSSVLHYKDYESGKIILKGVFDVTHKSQYKNFWGTTKEGIETTKCYQTYIFTIKDDSIKVEVVDVGYEFKRYYITTTYIPDRTFKFSIHDMYPITNFESSEWKEKLDLLNQTNIRINLLIRDLNSYIKDFQKDYKF